jgi:two-component system cell cycle response regulator
VNPKTSDRLLYYPNRINAHISLVDLSGRENGRFAAELQRQVIQPNVTAIVDRFHEALSGLDEFQVVISSRSTTVDLKDVHRRYLLTLAAGYERQEYFDDRLRIGLAHQRAGVSLRLYQCTYRVLQSLLMEYIPEKIRADQKEYDSFVQFILKITALDMSLAIEAYHVDEVSHLQHTVDSVRDEGQVLLRQVITDSLTSLSSRVFSFGSITTALCAAREESRPLCLVMADLDHFKPINDTLGHRLGDDVLRGVASRLLAGARKTDTVGRYGGDEFLFILRDTDIEESTEIAERIRLKVSEHPLHVGDSTVNVTLSLGIALARDTDDVDSIINRADKALYFAKQNGRDCVCIDKLEVT